MQGETGRPQDQGRRHRRGGEPSPETASLLARAQQAMRDDLSSLLDDIGGQLPDPGLGLLDDEPAARVRPSLKDRAPMWDLAVKLMRELGTEVDASAGVGASDQAAAPPAKRRRSRIDFG